MPTANLYAVSLTAGAVSTSGNALGAPNQTYAPPTADLNAQTNWTARWRLDTVAGTWTASGTQTVVLRMRAGTNTGVPQLTAATLYQNNVSLGSILPAAVNITNKTAAGQDITLTFAGSLLNGLAAVGVEVTVVGAGGSPSVRCTAGLDSITWTANYEAPAVAPVVSSTTVTPSTGTAGETVYTATISRSTPGTEPVTLSYQWRLDGANVGTNTATYTPTAAGSLTCVGTAANSAGASSAESVAVTVTAPAVAPTITSVAIDPATGAYGDTFTAIVTHTGTEPVTLSYQWLLDGSEIDGATSSTYTPPRTDIPAAITSVTIDPASGAYGDTFTAVVAHTGTEPVTLSYQWLADGVEIDGATASTYTVPPGGFPTADTAPAPPTGLQATIL